MNKLFAFFVLGASLVVFGVTEAPPSAAQGTKKEVKKDNKAGGGTVEIAEGKDGKFRFSVRNAEGKYLGGSGPVGFASQDDAKAAIDDLKKVLATATPSATCTRPTSPWSTPGRSAP